MSTDQSWYNTQGKHGQPHCLLGCSQSWLKPASMQSMQLSVRRLRTSCEAAFSLRPSCQERAALASFARPSYRCTVLYCSDGQNQALRSMAGCAHVPVNGMGIPVPGAAMAFVYRGTCLLVQSWRLLPPQHTHLLYDCFAREMASSFDPPDGSAAARFPNLALAASLTLDVDQVRCTIGCPAAAAVVAL